MNVEQWIADERERRKDKPAAAIFWEIVVGLRIPYLLNWLNEKVKGTR